MSLRYLPYCIGQPYIRTWNEEDAMPKGQRWIDDTTELLRADSPEHDQEFVSLGVENVSLEEIGI